MIPREDAIAVPDGVEVFVVDVVDVEMLMAVRISRRLPLLLSSEVAESSGWEPSWTNTCWTRSRKNDVGCDGPVFESLNPMKCL